MLFNILKPDMVDHKEALDFYFKKIEKKFGHESYKIYKISDYVTLSMNIYESELSKNYKIIEELYSKRLQLLTTLKGYKSIYFKNEAFLVLLDVDQKLAFYLHELKKEIRENFVYNTKKNYLHFLNLNEEILSKPLYNIDIDLLKAQIESVGSNEKFEKEDYNMIYFNKIHFPDPNPKSINLEFKIIKDFGIVRKRNEI